MTDNAPLRGVRVLDLTHFVAGPWCTMMLADLGADIVKLEPPAHGEIGRTMGGVYAGGESAIFLGFNRAKRDVALDLTTPDGQQAMHELAARADVVVQNFRPPVARRLGVDPGSLRSCYPNLICCAVSAFGSTGPYADRPANDPIIQAISGAMWLTRNTDGRPARMGVSLPDFAAAVLSGLAISAALCRRTRTGQGCSLELALLDAQLYAQGDRLDTRDDEPRGQAGLRRDAYGHYAYGHGDTTVPVHSLSAAIAAMTSEILEIAHPTAGMLRCLPTPIRSQPPLPGHRSAPPRLGEHTREVLAELGYDEAHLENLHRTGVIASAPPRDHTHSLNSTASAGNDEGAPGG